jgi:hypothetical protein
MRTPTSRSRTVRLTSLLAAPFIVGLVLGGCATSAAVPPTAAVSAGQPGVESVGRVTGGSARAPFDGLVGVVSNGTDVVAYVCDDQTRVGERFAGVLDPAGRAALRSEGGAALALTVTGTGAEGTFTAAGDTAPIAFTTTAATGEAGVYLADGETDGTVWGAGWVVLADGTQEGAAKENGEPRTVAPLRSQVREPVTRTVPPRTSAPTAAPTTSPSPAPTTAPAETTRVTDVQGTVDDPRQVTRLRSEALTEEVFCAHFPARCTS